MGLSGFRAIAIRPTPAEIEYELLSPMPRSRTLARPTAFSATSAAIAGSLVMLIVMLTSPSQFGGLPVSRQVGYLGFASGAAVVGFASHLFVAQRTRPSFLVALYVGALGLSVSDIVSRRSATPLTVAIEWLRDGPAVATIGATWLLAIAGVGLATYRAEELPLELIARGADVLDRAVFALAGNDFRSILLLQRSITNAWRGRPIVRFPSSLARRFPVTIRALRGVARWRYGRVLALAASATGSAMLLSVNHTSIRTLSLAAGALWIFGLVLGEPFAQENDRRDALMLLPDPSSVELRHIAVSWVFAAITMLGAMTFVGPGDAGRDVALAVAAASAATCAATITYRKRWRMMNAPAVAFDPAGFGGLSVVTQMLWPAIVAFICIVGLMTDAPPAATAARSLVVFAITLGFVARKRPE